MTGTTIRELIDQHAQHRPDAIFLIAPDSGQTMQYLQLQQHAQALAQQLMTDGIQKGDKVALLLDNGYWAAAIFLGVMYAGAVVVPMNAVAGSAVLDYVLEHSDARRLFVSPHYAGKYPALIATATERMYVNLVDDDYRLELADTSAHPPRDLPVSTEEDQAILIYTSGTTGRPKGVLLRQRNVLAGARNTIQAHQLTPADRGLCVLPLYHINAEIVSIISTLVCGSSVVLPQRFSVSIFWERLIRNECSWFSIVPTIVAYLLDHEERSPLSADARAYLREHIRFGRSASAPLSPEMHQDFEAKFTISLIETMGLTETSAQILSNPLPPGMIKSGSPGIPFGNEAKIINKQGQSCLPGESGELMIRGPNVMEGYYKNEQATRDALDSDGWLHTGDLATQDTDGYFFITGRLKELIIKGGGKHFTA